MIVCDPYLIPSNRWAAYEWFALAVLARFIQSRYGGYITFFGNNPYYASEVVSSGFQ